MYGGYSSPPLTNNPFIADSAPPSSRFPDISTPPSNPNQQQYASWGNGQMVGNGYPQQQQGLYQQQPQQYLQQPQFQAQPSVGYGVGAGQLQQQTGMGGGGGYFSPTQSYPSPTGSSAFQPSSSFGQQLAATVPANISGSSYAYLQGQPQAQQTANAYNPAQQQLQNNPGYIAQFDPYASIGQGWDGSHASNTSTPGLPQSQSTGSTTSSSGQSSAPSGGYGLSPTGDPHPRDYIRTHKAEVEAWDSYAWKQLLGSFEALMRAWEARKNELMRRISELSAQMAYGGYYAAQIQQEGARLQVLQKEAENNYDSVAASTYQMKEVLSGYRQSSDVASKRRVREATNAALQGLPGWPQPY